jgi:hypothetical protein
MNREDENADTEGLALGQPYTRSSEQCGWSRMVEGLGGSILHRVNHCIDMKIASSVYANLIGEGNP